MVMINSSLLLEQKYTGPLKVIIHTSEGVVESFKLNFTDTTLFVYVGQACAVIFTNLTTSLTVESRAEDWEVISFSPEKQILEVQQVGGEILKIEDDNLERLDELDALFESEL